MKFCTLILTLGILAGLSSANIHSMTAQTRRQIIQAKTALDQLLKKNVASMQENEYQVWLKTTSTHLDTITKLAPKLATRYRGSIATKKQQRRGWQKPPTPAEVPKEIAQKIHEITLVIEDLVEDLKVVKKNIITRAQSSTILEKTVQALEPIDKIYTEQQLNYSNLQQYKKSPIFKKFTAELVNTRAQLENNKNALLKDLSEDRKVVAGSFEQSGIQFIRNYQIRTIFDQRFSANPYEIK